MSEKSMHDAAKSKVLGGSAPQEASELDDQQLDEVAGGVGMLLPAIQKVEGTAVPPSDLTAEETAAEFKTARTR